MRKLFKRDRNGKPTPPPANGGNGKKPIIQLHDLVKVYSSEAGEFRVLKEIDAEIYEGEFVAVIGRSGSGKSTLLNMITGIDRPTSGEVFVRDIPVHTFNESDMAAWRGRNLGIVFQFFQLLPMLSLLENVMLPMDFCNMYSPRQRKQRAMHLLEMVELGAHARKLPSAVSGGEQQRVAIARALANDPPIILADEPTGNLDSKTASVVFNIFEDLVRQGKTVIMVTHDSSQAQRVNRTMLLVDGEIINEYIAKALPTLTPEQMARATRDLEPRRFEPGATILQEGQPGGAFYIITQGKVEVALKQPDGAEVIVARLGEGKFFGEIELMGKSPAVAHRMGGTVLRPGANAATVRAGEHTPVEVVVLEGDEMNALLEESQATRQAIEQAASKHLAENVNARTNGEA
jgi:ABC-type lipoprotein export system ATPase subunit